MRKRPSSHWMLLPATACLLSACMPAHRQLPPLSKVDLPAHWRESADEIGNTTNAVDAQWWQAFGDPTLVRLVENALAHNSNILVAVSRVDEARALLQAADATRLPALNATVGAQASHSLSGSGAATSRSVQPELQARWEIDLWGRLRAQTQVAELQYRASRAERDGVALGVAATTTQAYIGLLALDAQLDVTRSTAASRAEALQLASDQARLGYISQLQLTQAQSEHEAVLQVIPELELAIRRQENALKLLVGELPGNVIRQQSFRELRLPSAPMILPSDLLSRRPDIVQREALLAASDAGLASRRAEFLPQVTLSASLGSLFTNGLDYDPVTVWNVGGSILAPIFSAGRLSAQVDAAAARRNQAAYAYRDAVLNAFSEVENALSGITRLQAQMEHSGKRIDILTRTLGFARDRYQAGYAPYLEVLDAQRNLYQTELDAISLRQNQLDNLISLYRALGGGWSVQALDTVPSPSKQAQ